MHLSRWIYYLLNIQVWINQVYLKFYYLVNKSNAQDTIDIKTKMKNFDILE